MLRSELDSLLPRELIEALSIRIYEPPLSAARERLSDVSQPLRVVVLVLDFDTEVEMQGILGFLENSTGRYLAETIDAFEIIGARDTAEILRGIERTLQRHGITPARLRSDFSGSEVHQITTFRKLHGDLGTFPEEVQQEANRLYVYRREGEAIWTLLEAFVEENRQELLAEIARMIAQ